MFIVLNDPEVEITGGLSESPFPPPKTNPFTTYVLSACGRERADEAQPGSVSSL